LSSCRRAEAIHNNATSGARCKSRDSHKLSVEKLVKLAKLEVQAASDEWGISLGQFEMRPLGMH